MRPSDFPPLFHVFAIFAIMVLGGNSRLHGATNYTQPNIDSKELFPLEKIPLPRHNLKAISMKLVTLALRPQENTAANRRANAKLLALAMQLDPTNQTARKINKKLVNEPLTIFEPDSKINSTKSQIRFYEKWLATSEAGPAANQLAKYLSDATRILDPNQADRPDSADWSGVIPPLNAYKAPEKDVAETTDAPETTQDLEKNDPETDKPNSDAPEFAITSLTIKSPIKTEERKKSIDPITKEIKYTTIRRYNNTPVSVHLSKNSSDKSFKIRFSPSLPWLPMESLRTKALNQITTPITKALEARHKTLPNSLATVSVTPGQYSHFNEKAITAPIALMLEASLQNKPLRDDLQICAAINTKGELTQPKQFWELIKILRKNNETGRLIVSLESATLLSQLLVYEELDFFTRWEIFAAKNLDEAILLASKEGPPTINQSSELFKSIQDLTPKKSVLQLTNNKAVKQRLYQITQLTPNHLSAQILLLQGSSKRPRKLNEVALANELLPPILKIKKILRPGIEQNLPSYSKIKKYHQDIRSDLKEFEPFIDKNQNDNYKAILDILNDLRRLSTLSRRIAHSDYSDAIPLNRSASKLVTSMRNDCYMLLQKIDQTIEANAKDN